jgi:hypothetical protein
MKYLTKRDNICLGWTILLFNMVPLHGQGTVNFANRVNATAVDGRVTLEDGTPVGGNFQAQLFAAHAGASLSELKPIFPITSFRANRPEVMGYIDPIILTIPNIPAGARAVVLMKAFDGSNWETSTYRGESNPVTVTLANGGLPPDLVGLQPFQVHLVPEPCACALFVFGVGAFFLTLRRRRAV